MATTTGNGVYYDPYDFEIDKDPYPVWKRLRDEKPLYYNEKYDFFALSRFEDVERCSKDWRRYSSAKGTLLELIRSGMQIPPGSIISAQSPRRARRLPMPMSSAQVPCLPDCFRRWSQARHAGCAGRWAKPPI